MYRGVQIFTMRANILDKRVVLVLNRCWQAVAAVTPREALCQMATDAATGLDVGADGTMSPVRWSDWLDLPVREGDFSVGTAHGAVRVPEVLVLLRFAKVPMVRPRFSLRGLYERDGGLCQYTGRPLAPGEGNIDHVVPRSRGGRTSWDNCVLADRKVNHRKADRTPAEAGLKLLKRPREPRALPVTVTLKNPHGIKAWEPFLPSVTAA